MAFIVKRVPMGKVDTQQTNGWGKYKRANCSSN